VTVSSTERPATEQRPTGPGLEAAIRSGMRGQSELAGTLARYRTRLPLRYWSQAAHYTTPAADEPMGRKAVEGGTAPMARILDRYAISPGELAGRLGEDRDSVEELLARPRRAPLVMLDGEDAQALREDVSAEGVRAASAILADADWVGDGPGTLRFFRPPGFNLASSVPDLHRLLWALAERSTPETFPLDGIVFPKVDHPEEVDLLYGILAGAERALGLQEGRIRVAFLIESGWAGAQIAEIARRAAPRLCALIFGIADYSADLGLRAIATDHLLADWARAEIINVAGAVGVPAIDGMTLDYPVADPALDRDANRERILARLALVHGDAVRAREIGMAGKWVGHPAQLFAVLLAFEAGLRPADLEREAGKLAAYRSSVEDDARGSTIIGGVMSDRATDRHAREVLRRATAIGRFDHERALQLGVIGLDDIDGPRAGGGL
jgi:citrate lyase beta subunit